MAKTIDIRITTTADLAGARAIDQALARIVAATKQVTAGGGGGRGASPFAAAADDAARAEKDILRYASAMAGAQRATGDTAGAVQTLSAAHAQMTPNTIEAFQATTKLSSAQATLAKELSGGASMAQQFGSAVSSGLMNIIGPAALAAGAIKAIGEAGALVQLGAQAQQTAVRFDQLAVQAHTTGDAMLASLRQASAGTISDTNLQLAAMKANLLGVATSADQLAPLLAIARDRAQQMGISTADAFDSLVTGLGRGSKLILDNIGVMVKEGEVNRAYAASIGVSVSALTDQQKKQALINEVLRQGNETMAATGGAVESSVTKLERLGAAWDNVKAKIGGGLADTAAPAVEGLSNVLNGQVAITKESTEALDRYNAKLEALSGNIGPLITSELNDAQAKQDQAAAAALVASTNVGLSAATQAASGAVQANAAAAEAHAAALQQASAAAEQHTAGMREDAAAAEALTALTQQSTQAQMVQADAMEMTGVQARAAAMAAEQKSAADQVGAVDAQTHAVAMQALAEQAQTAAAGLMASGSQGAATAAQLANSSSLVDILTAAYYRLAAAQAAAGSATAAKTAVSDFRAGERSGGTVRTQKEEIALANRQSDIQRAQARTAQEQLHADMAIARAKGDQRTQVQLLRQEQAGLIKGSAEYKNIEAQIISAEKSRAGGGGRAGGGAAAKTAKAAEATAGRLEDIGRSSGNKLADIEEQTQAKLAAIDAKYAAQRVAAMRALNDQIAEMSAGAAVDQQLNDFDQFQKDITDAQKQAFAAREAAEVHYNERVAQAQEEARQTATNGSADEASDVLRIREAAAKKKQEIETRAAQANIDTGGKQAVAVAQQAAEATAAVDTQASTEIAIAQAKAAEKAGAEQAEKDAVIAAANEQKDKVIGAAEEQASKVKGASDSQKATVIGNLQAQAAAAGAWASDIESSARRAQSAMGSVTGPSASSGTGGEGGGGDNQAGGGGTFVTRGPTTLRLGDNPGGIEAVSVVPISGRGTTRASGNLVRMAGGGTLMAAGSGGSPTVASAISTLTDASQIINILKPFVAANAGVLKLLNQYKSIVTAAVGSLLAIQDLRERLVMPSPVLDPTVVAKLKSDVELVLNMMISIDASAIKKIGVFGKYLTTEKEAIEILTQMQDLRDKLATPTPPISVPYIQALMRDSQAVLNILLGSFIPLKQRQVDDLKLYAEAEGASVAILTGVADLRTKLSGDTGSAFNLGLLRGLAARAADITRMIQTELVPLSEEQAAGFKRYADVAASAVQILTDVADLRKRLSEDTGTAFNMALIKGLAMRAAQILQIVMAQLIPTTEAQAAAMQRYGDAAGNAVAILKNVADLRKQLSEATGGPLDMKAIAKLANEARQILQIVQAQLVPTSEATAGGLSTYADAVGSAVEIVRDVAGLRKDTAELTGPIPVQTITDLAAEAKRIDQIVRAVLIPTTEEEAKGLGQYGDAVGAAVGIVRDVAALRKDAADLASPIPEAAIIRLADEGKRITQIVRRRMVPVSEAEAAAARRFADTEGAAIDALKSALDMPAKLFADYRSPSDTQIGMVVADANRIIRQVDKAARAYDTKGLDAAKAFSEAVGGTFSAFKDGLLFFEALNSGDFRLDPRNLATFEASMGQTIAVAGRLGQQAVAIPAANVAALQSVTAALTASYESMIKLAAVPFGNISGAAGALGGGGVGGGSVTNIYINNPPAGMNVSAVVQQIRQGLGQSLGARR